MAGQPYENADVDALLDALGGAQTSVLVTSAGDAVAGKDARTGRRFRVPFRRIPGEHWGTGDRFCALLLDATGTAGFRSNRRPSAPATGCMKPF